MANYSKDFTDWTQIAPGSEDWAQYLQAADNGGDLSGYKFDADNGWIYKNAGTHQGFDLNQYALDNGYQGGLGSAGGFGNEQLPFGDSKASDPSRFYSYNGDSNLYKQLHGAFDQFQTDGAKSLDEIAADNYLDYNINQGRRLDQSTNTYGNLKNILNSYMNQDAIKSKRGGSEFDLAQAMPNYNDLYQQEELNAGDRNAAFQNNHQGWYEFAGGAGSVLLGALTGALGAWLAPAAEAGTAASAAASAEGGAAGAGAGAASGAAGSTAADATWQGLAKFLGYTGTKSGLIDSKYGSLLNLATGAVGNGSADWMSNSGSTTMGDEGSFDWSGVDYGMGDQGLSSDFSGSLPNWQGVADSGQNQDLGSLPNWQGITEQQSGSTTGGLQGLLQNILGGGQKGGYQLPVGNLLGGLMGLYSANQNKNQVNQIMNRATSTADPFQNNRAASGNLLMQSYTNPSAIYNSPEMQALQTIFGNQYDANAAAGGRTSDTTSRAVALQNNFLANLNAYRQNLMGMSGANANPGQQSLAMQSLLPQLMQGNNQQNNSIGYILNQILNGQQPNVTGGQGSNLPQQMGGNQNLLQLLMQLYGNQQ